MSDCLAIGFVNDDREQSDDGSTLRSRWAIQAANMMPPEYQNDVPGGFVDFADQIGELGIVEHDYTFTRVERL